MLIVFHFEKRLLLRSDMLVLPFGMYSSLKCVFYVARAIAMNATEALIKLTTCRIMKKKVSLNKIIFYLQISLKNHFIY